MLNVMTVPVLMGFGEAVAFKIMLFGCSLTLAGYGYPFTQVRGPHLPLEVDGKFDVKDRTRPGGQAL